MSLNKSNLVRYKRDKGKVEITGDVQNVKKFIWFDLISFRITLFGNYYLDRYYRLQV